MLEGTLADPLLFDSAISHLKRADATLSSLILRHGKIEFTPSDDIFSSLVYSMISQQLSTKVADAISSRVEKLLGGAKLTPAGFKKVRSERLRKAGMSPQKITYLRDLCKRVQQGSIDLRSLKKKTDDQVLSELDRIRGVGPWTAKMILIFCLGRPDVIAPQDVGLQGAIRKVYSLRRPPGKDQIEKISISWHPFCSVASLYLWKERDSD